MAQQVKFYSVSALPATASTTGAGGIYFVNGGELYKGSQRFGLGRVTTAATADALAALTGVARGDINVGFEGAKVFDGEAWQPLGGDIASLQSSWRADISTWTAGLSAGDSSSYIAYIEQANDGKVTAHAVAFPDLTFATGDADGQVKLGNTNATVSGWGALVASVGANTTAITGLSTKVSTLETKVSGIEGIVDVTNSKVTATTGSFTNLTVTDTATFSVTNVSASSLTVNGSTIEQLADKQIGAIAASTVTSTATGITVGVTTQGGSVTAVSVDASSFGNVMHFLGVGTVTKNGSVVVVTPPAGKTPVAGDIVIDSTTGLEAICTSATTGESPTYTWELIGDNAVYALNAYSSSATVYTSITTVPGALNAVGAAADTFKAALDAKVTTADNVSTVGEASNLVTAGAVTSYVAREINALSLGDAAKKGVANTIAAGGTSLPTESAVAAYVSTVVSGLDSNVSSSENNSIQVGVTQVDGKVTAVTADLVWLDASGAVIE